MTVEVMEGKIYRVVRDKGFFFVRMLNGSDWFAHRTELRDGWTFQDLHEGMTVSFTPVPDAPKGKRATDVHVLYNGE